MARRKVNQEDRHVHFVTFSCYRRRTHLSLDRCKRIVIGQLGKHLKKQNGICPGFVVMPDHVHALVWFSELKQVSPLMQKWKEQSSKEIKAFLNSQCANYLESFDATEPIWQPRYYDFNIWSRRKLEEKLDYMHMNAVRAGLVEKAIDWRFSSARWYESREFVGIDLDCPPGMEADDEFTVFP